MDGNGNQLATVTCFAQKQSNPIIRNVMPFVRNYNNKAVTKSANQKVIDDGVYPSRIHYGIVTKSGGKTSGLINGLTGKNEKVKNLTPEEQKEFLQNLTQKERENIGITNLSDYLGKVEKVIQESQKENKEYWDTMDMVATNIIKMTDEEIEEKLAAERTKGGHVNEDHVISRYEQIEDLIWHDYCGPSAMSWVYRGLYSSYYAFDIPSSGGIGDGFGDHEAFNLFKKSKEQDGGLYYYFTSELCEYKNGYYINGADEGKYDSSLRKATSGKYGVKTIWFKGAIHDHIRKKNLPVLSYYATDLIGINDDAHVRVLYGSRYYVYKWKKWVKILWWGYWDKGRIVKKKFWKVHDNGIHMGPHGEDDKVEPYWENETVEGIDRLWQHAVYKR